MENDMPMTIHTSKSKPEIELQNGGRPFSETGSSFYLSRGLMYLIEIWQANRFPLSSTNSVTKPELGSTFPTVCRHLEKSI